MKYLDFITDEKFLSDLKGSSNDRLSQLEDQLGHKLPAALKEYLLLMGERTSLYDEWDEHGTEDIVKLKHWLYDWVGRYRAEGLALSEIKDVLPFFNFQDTFFYVPLEDGNDDPPVFAFDINDRPTIRRLNDRFSGFVRRLYARRSSFLCSNSSYGAGNRRGI